MATRMQQRRDTAENWALSDPILAPGEIGFETDTGEFRIGDGSSNWSILSPFKNIVDLGGNLDDYILLAQKGTNNGVATLDSTGNVPLSQLNNVDALPSQSGNTGKYLTTDGTTATWAPAATQTPHPFAMIG